MLVQDQTRVRAIQREQLYTRPGDAARRKEVTATDLVHSLNRLDRPSRRRDHQVEHRWDTGRHFDQVAWRLVHARLHVKSLAPSGQEESSEEVDCAPEKLDDI
jgi:hypothetical protein